MKKLGKYSFGIGDRFMQEGIFQLSAFVEAKKLGVDITPVWNKSFREHKTVGTDPKTVRQEADDAVKRAGWDQPYFVDADHITYGSVDAFIDVSDFFTIDVAAQISQNASNSELGEFVKEYSPYVGELYIEGIKSPYVITNEFLGLIANKYLKAVNEANRIYKKIEESKGNDNFVIEVSMDEVDKPQNPLELFFILKMLSKLNIPVQTIAPKFTGRFNKGTDYEGDLKAFEKEFEENILVIKHCVKYFGLPQDLKLSVHTGSDKFSLYPVINKLIKKHHVGLHLKTAGTTWLEEVIGLAEAGGAALAMIKEIYREAIGRYDELTGPYETVLNIDKNLLPAVEEVSEWEGQQFVNSLVHDQNNPDYNPSLRQLFHTAYKIAAEKGEAFMDLLKEHRALTGKNVAKNILDRHIKHLYL